MAHCKNDQDDWLVIYLKYLLFVFNFFWIRGAAVMVEGVWTLTEKSSYLSILGSSIFTASTYTLISEGTLIMVTGFLGCCTIVWEQRGCVSVYFCLLFAILLAELMAGVLYQKVSGRVMNLNHTLVENCGQPRAVEITTLVDQWIIKCCGSNSSVDSQHSTYIQFQETQGCWVPDSCCNRVKAHCSQWVYPLQYLQSGGCITKLEQLLADPLMLMGSVGIGVFCGMILTCCLHQRLWGHFY
uniref:Tetraspanin n=1 Tax=Chinchilla lanigera TaxID=34839 RepID=A0A8C2VSX9_CHILA